MKGTPLCLSHRYEPVPPKPRAARDASRRRAFVDLQQEIMGEVREIEKLIRWAKLNEVPHHFLDALKECRRRLAELAEGECGSPPVPAVPRKIAGQQSVSDGVAVTADLKSQEELAVVQIRDRALGAMLGLAVGEAYGVTTAGIERGTFREMTEMHGRGLLDLKPGEWAWDTAAMLALSYNLIENSSFDERDYLQRVVEHRDHEIYSPGSKKILPGNMTALALSRFEQFGELIAIEQPNVRPTNGCLARLAPVAVRYWQNPEVMAEIAERQARTTHSGAGVEELSRSFAEAVGMAIAGHAKAALLSGRFGKEQWGRTLTYGELCQVPRSRIASDQDARRSVDAALWCVATGDGFKSALLQARNLGGDATSIGAMAGQLAGAIYGVRAIPRDWLELLAGRELIESAASQLFDAGMA